MSNHVPMITEAEFEEAVLRATVPVLVDFGAEWCAPCRAMDPIVEKIAESGRARVVKIDADASASIAAKYRVRALPTVIAFSDGREQNRHTGATSMETLLRLLPTT